MDRVHVALLHKYTCRFSALAENSFNFSREPVLLYHRRSHQSIFFALAAERGHGVHFHKGIKYEA